MIVAGQGYRIHSTGLTHDEKGYPVMQADAQHKLVNRLVDKIRKNAEDIIEIEEEQTEDADIIVMAYGITSRVTLPAIIKAREKGLKVGYIKMITVWPFPERRVRELAKKAKAFVMPEINLGQVVLELERVVAGKAKVFHVPHAGGWVHDPEDIYQVIQEATK
jgi:2-oxoglutarate ferredoxin oxidoreductase subunit alpha